MTERKRCAWCDTLKPPVEYTIGSTVCKKCRRERERKNVQLRKRRDWIRIMGWPAPLLLVMATGIFSHDEVMDNTRICYYTSDYGTHVFTVDKRFECPMSKRFKVDE